MAVSKITARVSTVVSYADNSKRQIMATLSDDGQIAINANGGDDIISLGLEQVETAADVGADTGAWSSFALVSNGTTYNIAPSGAAGPGSVVSVNVDINGRVAFDDNTSDDWFYRFDMRPPRGPLMPIEQDGGDLFDAAFNDPVAGPLLVDTFAAAGLDIVPV